MQLGTARSNDSGLTVEVVGYEERADLRKPDGDPKAVQKVTYKITKLASNPHHRSKVAVGDVRTLNLKPFNVTFPHET